MVYVTLKGQLVDFFLYETPAKLQQKDVDVLNLLFLSVKGIIALKPALAATIFKLCIKSSLVSERKLKFSKSSVNTKESLSNSLSCEVASLIEK